MRDNENAMRDAAGAPRIDPDSRGASDQSAVSADDRSMDDAALEGPGAPASDPGSRAMSEDSDAANEPLNPS